MSIAYVDLGVLRERVVLKRLLAVTLGAALLGLAYGFLAPKWYRSVLTVLPAKSPKGGGGISEILGGNLAGLAASLDGGGGSTDATRIAAVLQSVSVTDAVIEKFDLQTRYGEKYRENARMALWKHCAVEILAKPNLVQLSCEDKDPRFAQEMLAFFSEHGNRVFRRVGMGSASEEVRFLEKRVAELRQASETASSRMRDFEEKYRIVDLETQGKAVVSALASLNSQRISKQLELEYARSFSAEGEAALRQLESQIAVVDRKLRDLEASPGPGPEGKRPASGGMFPPALEVPRIRSEFEGLYRDRKVAEAMLVFSMERLEAARANEARDVSTFLVLDPPTMPTRHTRPRRLLVLLGTALVGFVGAAGVEMWRSRRRMQGLGAVGEEPRQSAAAAENRAG